MPWWLDAIPALQADSSADESRSWEAFLAAAQQLGSTHVPPDDLRQRFTAVAAYQQAADIQAQPVQHIKRLLQVKQASIVVLHPVVISSWM